MPLLFPRILERNGWLEMGWRLLEMLGCKLGFFRVGVTAAALKDDGTVPKEREY